MPNVKHKNKSVRLGQNNFVGSGGFGEVYSIGNTAYKIYFDTKNVIPVSRIQELSCLKDPKIIKPEDILSNNKGEIIGYTMRYIKNSIPLCRIFNKSFKTTQNISQQDISRMVVEFQDTVQHVHDNDVLIVDCNEMNFILDKSLSDIYFIDVDSYQTKNFPATALMESVRDRHSPKGQFSVNTDWFSWAVVTFQMFVGIHPYKGKHSSLGTMEERMQKNVSVFSKDVSIPKMCYSFDTIPKEYREWYFKTFEKGERKLPPGNATLGGVSLPIKPIVIKGSKNFVFDLIGTYDSNIAWAGLLNGRRIVRTQKTTYVDNKVNPNILSDHKLGIDNNGQIIAGRVEHNKTKFFNVTTGKPIEQTFVSDSIVSINGKLYSVNDGTIFRVNNTQVGAKSFINLKPVSSLISGATKIYDNIIIQSLPLKKFALIIEQDNSFNVELKELTNEKIVDAKYNNKILCVISVTNTGTYNKHTFRFNGTYNDYNHWKKENLSTPSLNFATLDNGKIVYIDEEDNMNIFLNVIDSKQYTTIDDPIISSDFDVWSDGGSALISKNENLYSIRSSK